MTIVAVHGVPETAAVWDELALALRARGHEIVRLSPPGFGAPLPDGFEPHPDAYGRWLAAEIDGLDAGPVDVIGHDWGAGHVARLVADRPDLVRSWAVDCGGLLHADYVWHDTAQVWQTPGAGEEALAGMVAVPKADLAALYVGLGLTEAIAASFAEAMTEEMATAILGLYRGGAQPYLGELADRLAALESVPPGLIITAADDAYVSPVLAGEAARRLGLTETVLDGAGHWWAATHADEAAESLAGFWAGLDG